MVKVRKFLKDEKGAALPFVAIILGLFALGFVALAVDLGIVYIDRKEMITSADAAALAGAQVLENSDGKKVKEAREAAIEFAKKNGADESLFTVPTNPNTPDTPENPHNPYVGSKSVTLPDGSTDVRQVVEITVEKKQPLVFARFLGDENANVKAHAVATWGYIKATYMNFLPLFVFDSTYEQSDDIKGIDLFLHDKVDPSNNGYGLIDVSGSINPLIAGTSSGGTIIYNNLLDGKSGKMEDVYGAVVDRMENAQAKSTDEEKRNYMIGLVPVIDRDAFDAIDANQKGNASQWKLPIKYFAYFEILDVIKQNETDGSPEALILNSDNHYVRRGEPTAEYKDFLEHNNLLALTGNGDEKGADSTIIYGRFTGQTVPATVDSNVGDQVKPNNHGSPPAPYIKLIQ